MRLTFLRGVGLGGDAVAQPGETHEVPDAFGYALLFDGRARRAGEEREAPLPTPPDVVETRDPLVRRSR